MRPTILIFLAIVAIGHGKPTSDSFRGLSEETMEDATNLAKAKVAVLSYTGESVNEAAAYVGNSALEFAASIDPIEVTDNLEQQVLDSKETSIKAVFEAKRALIKGIQAATEEHGDQISALVDSSIQGVNEALDYTAEGLVVTKNAVAEFSTQITLENTQQALSDAFNASASIIQQTVDGLVKSLVAAKEQLNENVQDFNSEEALAETKLSISSALDSSTSVAGDAAEGYGIFKGIDHVVKTLAQLPLEINKMFQQVEVEVGNKFEVTKEALVEVAIEDNEEVEEVEASNPEPTREEEMNLAVDMEATNEAFI